MCFRLSLDLFSLFLLCSELFLLDMYLYVLFVVVSCVCACVCVMCISVCKPLVCITLKKKKKLQPSESVSWTLWMFCVCGAGSCVVLRCLALCSVPLLISQTQGLRLPRWLGLKDNAGVFSSVAATFEVSHHETEMLMLKKKLRPAECVLWKSCYLNQFMITLTSAQSSKQPIPSYTRIPTFLFFQITELKKNIHHYIIIRQPQAKRKLL